MDINNNHLTIRQQFYVRMSNDILRDPDTAYLFMGVVCETVSMTELPMIEMVFKNKIQQKAESKN